MSELTVMAEENTLKSQNSPASRRGQLQVYIHSGCFSCQETLLLVAEIRKRFPQLLTEIISLDDPANETPEEVFAVPTWMLDGRVIFLGNPWREQMYEKLSASLPACQIF